MNRAELAEQLLADGGTDPATLLTLHPLLVDVELARRLKEDCYAAWASNPVRAQRAARALEAMARTSADTEVQALSAWTTGIAALIDGQMEQALIHLDAAASGFESANQPYTVALTRVPKLMALAMLGRYDEAVETGSSARDVFNSAGDPLATGKIELNLGNLHHRRGDYHTAETSYRSAREHFRTSDEKWLSMAENGLANILAGQHKFREATALYEQALERAQTSGNELTAAELECNIGALDIVRGRYDHALDYLERSRRRYASLEMAHELATVELELADAYLELNLMPEAGALYERIIPTFATLGMRAEQAQALAHQARTLIPLGRADDARTALGQAAGLYQAEGNDVGVATVNVIAAQLDFTEGNFAQAAEQAARADTAFEQAGVWGRRLLARWVRAEALRNLGESDAAQQLLLPTLQTAEEQVVPAMIQRCLTSLGLLALQRGDTTAAEAFFHRAVTVTEALRAPLPADEFRIAFIADKLTPYAELVRICLADGTAERTAEAFTYVEAARARSLVELVSGMLQEPQRPQDEFDAALLQRLEELREELNGLYNRINRGSLSGEGERQSREAGVMSTEVRQREADLLEVQRQLYQRGRSLSFQSEPASTDILGQALGDDCALVSYYILDDEILAFVVTDAGVTLTRSLAQESNVEQLLQQLRFQIDSLRFGAERVRSHVDQLTQRARHYLRRLYDQLVRPLEPQLGGRHMIVVPYRSLHYIPFHALYDGTAYMIERREVTYAPSAAIWWHCRQRPYRPFHSALLVGVADIRTPRVQDEVATVAPLFAKTITLIGDQATRAAVQAHAGSVDVLHLACHGQFRPDNPLFSALQLADGWMTVRDAAALDLNCQLVSLSACETGVSEIAPGDELLGLARGFFASGAPSLLVSLWTVDDDATAILMGDFFANINAGEHPAAALRHAQCRLLREKPHPFFWSPFILLGRS